MQKYYFLILKVLQEMTACLLTNVPPLHAYELEFIWHQSYMSTYETCLILNNVCKYINNKIRQKTEGHLRVWISKNGTILE